MADPYSADSNRDHAGRQALHSVFGEFIVGQRVADVLIQFQYGITTTNLTSAVTGTGAVTNGAATATLSSGASTGLARLQSTVPLRYQPGFEGWALFTAAFIDGEAGVAQRAGLFDAEDGMYFGVVDGVFTCGVRKDSTDTLLAAETSQLRGFDFTNMNIYRISYGWLGVAPITFEVFGGSKIGWIVVARYEILNTQTGPSIGQPALPVRMEVIRTSGSGVATIKTSSWAAGRVSAVQNIPSDRGFSASSSKTNITTRTNVLTIRTKTTLNTVNSHIVVECALLSLAVEGSKPVVIRASRGSTLGGTPSYTSVNATESVVEYDVAGTTVTGGTEELVIPLGRTSSAVLYLEDQHIHIHPGETLTFSAESANAADVVVGFRWKEQF